jgi:hypothetical protein
VRLRAACTAVVTKHQRTDQHSSSPPEGEQVPLPPVTLQTMLAALPSGCVAAVELAYAWSGEGYGVLTHGSVALIERHLRELTEPQYPAGSREDAANALAVLRAGMWDLTPLHSWPIYVVPWDAGRDGPVPDRYWRPTRKIIATTREPPDLPEGSRPNERLRL